MCSDVRLGTLVGIVVLAIACNDVERPSVPFSPSVHQPPSTQPPPTGGVPPVVPVNGTFVFRRPLSYRVQDYTMQSRYVLRDSGDFTLEYPSINRAYGGRYQHENGRLVFQFTAENHWSAAGTLNDDVLEVRYNLSMGHSDFEDAVYGRSQ